MESNILWIIADQHRGQAMSCAGDPNIQTPNLDALAAHGPPQSAIASLERHEAFLKGKEWQFGNGMI
ncbi:hypothetical protein ACFLQU_01710 [Verrucomicrobiota bacterium]